MLNRQADSLIWLARMIERAENNARMLEVYYAESLEEKASYWESLVAVTGDVALYRQQYKNVDSLSVFEFLSFSDQNPNSIYCCLHQAKENALVAREILPNEIYEVVNSFYLVVRTCAQKLQGKSPLEFLHLVKKRSLLFQGMVEAILPQNKGWAFLQLGRYLERADKTARIIDAAVGHPKSHQENLWLRVLLSVSAYEAYRREWCGRIGAREVTEFLVHQADFPRSLSFSVAHALEAADKAFQNGAQVVEPIQLLEHLDQQLRMTAIEEIERQGVHNFLQSFLSENNKVGDAVNHTLFRGPSTA
ncbi:alpha-E domain-containing protein [Heliorestis convoluta]|uniref:Alpha-E domain-containing protein n=1 Tax=Heliorestis convoluta TaxID=356322 RepID=A0A5Q2MVZ1_9FIRM|nr:alpha-E domain-containing protein [Heliorestis convoluta]QGG46474.1 alpha-E domain-containing protein [Heliorestis convoluta]